MTWLFLLLDALLRRQERRDELEYERRRALQRELEEKERKRQADAPRDYY